LGLQAWVAWRDQQLEEAMAYGAQALELWETTPYCYPWHCLARWPLAGAHLDAGHLREAIVATRLLLDPAQFQLPDDLEVAVRAACDAWDGAGSELAGWLLEDAVRLARDRGYA
jgi:hypothetical protein